MMMMVMMVMMIMITMASARFIPPPHEPGAQQRWRQREQCPSRSHLASPVYTPAWTVRSRQSGEQCWLRGIRMATDHQRSSLLCCNTQRYGRSSVDSDERERKNVGIHISFVHWAVNESIYLHVSVKIRTVSGKNRRMVFGTEL